MTSVAGDYVHFKAYVPLHHISVGPSQWRYYDHGPKSVAPVVCLCGIAGTADVFYKQIMALSIKGYRIIAADAPAVRNHQEWITSFEKFLDAIGVHHVHLYGTSLGGFLAQLFTQYRSRRVKSILLSNTFLDTRSFYEGVAWSSLINWAPEFVLKRYILSAIQDGPQEPLIADSIDFVVNQLETLSRAELASRLILNTGLASIGHLSLSDSAITIMDTNDYCAVSQLLRDQVSARYPGARRAHLKSGGDFPFLSRAGEVSLHVQLHLRRAGVEGYVQPLRIDPTPKDRYDDPAGDTDGNTSKKDQPQQHKSNSLRHLIEDSLPAAGDNSFVSDGSHSSMTRKLKHCNYRFIPVHNSVVGKMQDIHANWFESFGAILQVKRLSRVVEVS